MNKTKPAHPFFSFALVALQFGLILLLVLSTAITLHPFALLLQASAALIGLWAVQTMHLGRFNIIPDPMPDIQLVTTGPYRFIRHPMYFSILLFFLYQCISHKVSSLFIFSEKFIFSSLFFINS